MREKRNFNNVKLKLWLKLHKANKAGKSPISLRITINQQRTELTTDIRLHPDEWDQLTEKILPTRRAASTVAKDNDFLDELKADARQAKRSLPKAEQTAKNVANVLRGDAPAPPVCLLAALEQALSSHYRHANQHTLASFERAAVLLRQWHEQRPKKQGLLAITDFTTEARQDFTRFLLARMSPAGVRTYRIALTAMWCRTGIYTPDAAPFAGLKLPKHQVRPRASLTRGQLAILRGGMLPANQSHARNVYLACFYLHGSRILAVLQLRWRDFDGERVHYQAMKGGPLKAVVVSSGLRAILTQYEATSPDDFIFPYLERDYFTLPAPERYKLTKCAVAGVGYHLRKACLALGLPGNIHPHTARHTMARMTVEANHGDIRAAQHVLGHTSYRQTEAYVRSMLTEEVDVAASNVYDNL